jgi:hypothetical protein
MLNVAVFGADLAQPLGWELTVVVPTRRRPRLVTAAWHCANMVIIADPAGQLFVLIVPST